MKRYITVASGKQVPLGSYLKAVKLAISNPDVEFNEGLTCWWPCSGKEIRKQFLSSINDRINQGISYSRRGVE